MEIREYKAMFEVEDAHFWYKGMRKITKTLFDKYLPKNKQLKILDAGCGTGRNILFLKNYGQVSGFDISPYAIKYCKKRGLSNVKIGSVDKILLKNNSFDLVTCFDVLGQTEVKSVNKSIKKFYRVLKSDGVLLVRVAAYNWLMGYHDKAVHTRHRFEKNELETLLIKNKFRIIKVTYANSFLFPLAIIKRSLIKTATSDIKLVNRTINWLLKIPFLLEALSIRYFNLPFGLSIIILAKK